MDLVGSPAGRHRHELNRVASSVDLPGLFPSPDFGIALRLSPSRRLLTAGGDQCLDLVVSSDQPICAKGPRTTFPERSGHILTPGLHVRNGAALVPSQRGESLWLYPAARRNAASCRPSARRAAAMASVLGPMRAEVAAEFSAVPGLQRRRIRIVERPVSPYLQWQMHVLRMRAEEGEVVRLVDAKQVRDHERRRPLPELVIIGGSVLYQILYTSEGMLAGALRHLGVAYRVPATAKFGGEGVAGQSIPTAGEPVPGGAGSRQQGGNVRFVPGLHAGRPRPADGFLDRSHLRPWDGHWRCCRPQIAGRPMPHPGSCS